MNLARRVKILVRTAALWFALGAISLAVTLAGIGFLVTAAFAWLSTRFHPAEAASLLGGGLVLLAIVLVLIGGAIIKATKPNQPSMLAEFSGTIGLGARIIGMMVRKDPKKAIILSVIAGALAEYITSDRKK